MALSAGASRAIRVTAFMFAASAVDGLALWNLFPMHMRGELKTFTDAMHIVLSVNPFVWIAPTFARECSRPQGVWADFEERLIRHRSLTRGELARRAAIGISMGLICL